MMSVTLTEQWKTYIHILIPQSQIHPSMSYAYTRMSVLLASDFDECIVIDLNQIILLDMA